MATDPNKKTLRHFQCRDYLWETFEQLSAELECSVDYLINEAMRQYARSRQQGGARVSAPPGQRESAPPMPPIPAAGPASAAIAGATTRPAAGPPGRMPAIPAMPSTGSVGPKIPSLPSTPGASAASVARAPIGTPAVPSAKPGVPNLPPMRGPAMPSAPQARPGMPPMAAPTNAPRVPPMPSAPAMPAVPSMPSPALPPVAARQAPAPAPAPGPSTQTLYAFYDGQSYPVTKDEFIIGRGAKTTDLCIKDSNVSRRHAVVVLHNGQYWMVDQQSTNGVEFSGAKIDRKRIDDGDVFKICDYEITFTYR